MSEELQSMAHFWHTVRKYCLIAVLSSSIAVNLVLGLYIGSYFDEMDYINNGKEYTAVYIDIYENEEIVEDGTSYTHSYEMKYKYINEEGKECYGYGEIFYEEESAKSYLGKEVQVLENKKGNSMIKPTGEIVSLRARIIAFGILTGVNTVAIILVIIFRKRIFHFTPKKPKEKKVAKSE